MSTSPAQIYPGSPEINHAVYDGQHFYILRHHLNGYWVVDKYDPVAQTVVTVGPQLTAQYLGPAVYLNGAMYILGGTGLAPPASTNPVLRFDLSSYTYSFMNDHPATWQYGGGGFADGQYAYVVACQSMPCSTYRYNAVADSWTPLASWATAYPGGDGHSSATYGGNGKGYFVAAQWSPPAQADDIFVFDAATGQGTWHTNKLPIPVAGAALASVNGYVYVLGGHTVTGAPTDAIQIYDPATDTATVSSLTLPSPAAGQSAGGIGDCLLYHFGRDQTYIDHANICQQACVGPDQDCDGVADPNDNCDDVSNPDQADSDGDGIGNACDSSPGCNLTAPDYDCDGTPNASDNCENVYNPDQADTDGDGIGNACDSAPGCNPPTIDSDCDGVANPNDNCDDTANPDQTDTDGDGVGNACEPVSPGDDADADGVDNGSDNCPYASNSQQSDLDGDGQGDVCDQDDDGDGVPDGQDNCYQTANADQADADQDGTGNACDADPDTDGIDAANDNCDYVYNPDQADSDGDGIGDACEQPACPAQPCDGSSGNGGGDGTGGGNGQGNGTGDGNGNAGGGGTGNGDGQGGPNDGGQGNDGGDGTGGGNGTGDGAGDGAGDRGGNGGDEQNTAPGGGALAGGFLPEICPVTDRDCIEKAAMLQGDASQPRSTMVRPDSPGLSGPEIASVTAGGILATAGLWFSRFRWMAAAVVGLNRLRKKNVLDHPLRLAILDLAATNPGIHFLQLKREIGTGRGNLEHHLRVLLTAGLVREVKDKGFRCFFKPDPATAETMATAPVVKSTRAKHILNAIEAHPGLTMAELAREIGSTYRGAAYHVERLHGVGAANMQHEGGVLRIYPRGAR